MTTELLFHVPPWEGAELLMLFGSTQAFQINLYCNHPLRYIGPKKGSVGTDQLHWRLSSVHHPVSWIRHLSWWRHLISLAWSSRIVLRSQNYKYIIIYPLGLTPCSISEQCKICAGHCRVCVPVRVRACVCVCARACVRVTVVICVADNNANSWRTYKWQQVPNIQLQSRSKFVDSRSRS